MYSSSSSSPSTHTHITMINEVILLANARPVRYGEGGGFIQLALIAFSPGADISKPLFIVARLKSSARLKRCVMSGCKLIALHGRWPWCVGVEGDRVMSANTRDQRRWRVEVIMYLSSSSVIGQM